MRSVFALALLLAATGGPPVLEAIPQAAGAAPLAKGNRVYTGLPPDRFRGDVAIEVRFVSDVHSTCLPYAPWWPEGFRISACTIVNTATDTPLFIILPNPCNLFSEDRYYRPGKFAMTACHEIGHVNRWPGTHED